MNALIKKCSIALAFYRAFEAITAGTIELQHISREFNWSNFLTKVVENSNFITYIREFIDLQTKAMNL